MACRNDSGEPAGPVQNSPEFAFTVDESTGQDRQSSGLITLVVEQWLFVCESTQLVDMVQQINTTSLDPGLHWWVYFSILFPSIMFPSVYLWSPCCL